MPPKVGPNELLYSSSGFYKIVSVLGEGSYGQVLKCLKNNNTKQPCAVKYSKHDHLDLDEEYRILAEANKKGINEVLKVFEMFNDDGLNCIAMELAPMCLVDLMENLDLSPWIIGSIAYQLIVGIKSIHEELGIIHGDVKPENIVVSYYDGVTIKIKYIDFGCSIPKSETGVLQGRCIQSRYYRSPEVILDCGFSTPIDLWSIGCVLAELELGSPLFPGASDLEMLHYFHLATNEEFPTRMILNGTCSREFFTCKLQLKELDGLYALMPSVPILEELADPGIPETEYFVDFIKGLLILNPDERAKPSDCLAHPYFSHFVLSQIVANLVTFGDISPKAC